MVVVLMLSTSTLFTQKENIANKNIAFYAHVWDVVLNEGRVNILDTTYAENAVLHTIPATKEKANCIAY